VALEDEIGVGLDELVTILFTLVIVIAYPLSALDLAEISDQMVRITDLTIGFIIGRVASMPGRGANNDT